MQVVVEVMEVETTRRSSSAVGDPCYGTSMSSSACLPDGYRTFQVYCDFSGFKLISMRLLQYCSCKRYNRCGFWVPQIIIENNILLCNKTLKDVFYHSSWLINFKVWKHSVFLFRKKKTAKYLKIFYNSYCCFLYLQIKEKEYLTLI